MEKFEHLISLWIPKNNSSSSGVNSHCERMRKISNMRARPRRISRIRSETMLSTTSWQDVDIDEVNRRKRAESCLSTISSGSGDVDLSSIMPYDPLVEMMTSKEVSQAGVVKLSVFLSYIKSMTGCLFVIFLLFLLFAECWSAAARIWLAHWTSSSTGKHSPTEHTRDLGIYGGLGFSQAVFVLLACFIQAFGSVKASSRLHHGLLTNVLHSPMTFFESTPLGRIVNRFSKDIDMIDDLVPRSFIGFMRSSLELLAAIVIISFAMPFFLTVILPLGLLYIFIQRVYAATSRQLRRMESISRSPIYNHFFETMNGVSTIRAYSQQQRFIQENFSKVDENQVANYPTMISYRWLGLRLDFIGNCAILFAAIFAAVSRDKLESGLAGLSIVYALQITRNLSWMVRKGTELESSIVSVERVKEYSENTKEAEWIITESRPPNEWPQNGNITFDVFDLRYREGLPLVLKHINCIITPGEKIGIVGRTGAGKSTLTQALFRILERAGGNILIDDIDIATIGLHDLRSRLTIIPQDPVLFSGTLRLNLDPFGRHTDEELWQILDASHLKRFISETARGLHFIVIEGGDNLSVGERQLVCLARALLRKGKILILDEATSAVDLETDELIQQTIRREFADCTVFTIAHRLNTIMDYTRIMVLDKGLVVEFDTPLNLLAQKGIFYSMAKEAGIA
ncbi:Multidrug resistance-associated protein 1 [Desmophyllum pertusum]|uniref:ABC-type glutathione-S-conjugate transporter n=1 Tax=Desmophyllum pertusum TaxID=174260 RepID=A0A9W9ZZC9_9CNID|nr:Multidrug resistance-associated protein 1 [Desmophyllum pertusum]